MKKVNVFGYILFSFASVVLLSGEAHAYIDPGTGSMFLQALIAGIAACSVSVGMFWKRIRAYFQRSAVKKTENSDDASRK